MNDTNPTVAEQHDEYCNRPYSVSCVLCEIHKTASQQTLIEKLGWYLSAQGEFCGACKFTDAAVNLRWTRGWEQLRVRPIPSRFMTRETPEPVAADEHPEDTTCNCGDEKPYGELHCEACAAVYMPRKGATKRAYGA